MYLVVKVLKYNRFEVIPQEFISYDTALKYTKTKSFLTKENFYITEVTAKVNGKYIIERKSI